jgi:hypothetical protein
MTNKIGLTRISLISAGLLAATIMFASCTPSAAQERFATSTDFSAQQQQDKGGSRKAAPAARSAQPQRAAPQRAAPQRAAPQRAAPQRAAPRVAAPQRTAPRTVTQTRATSRVVRQPTATSRAVRQPKATSRTVTQRKATSRAVTQPKATSRAVRQPKATSRAVTQQKAAPRVVTPRGTRTVTASRLRGVPARGAGRTVIRGHNYSAWRSGYRIRHGSGWWTFAALSTLGAIAIGSSEYYPYAYISAPEPYCEGLTQDGCELMWQEVETIEGDVVNQCVAYCPWQ